MTAWSLANLPIGIEYLIGGIAFLALALALVSALRYRLAARSVAALVGSALLLFVSDRLATALSLWRTELPLGRKYGPVSIIREWESPGTFWFAVLLWSIFFAFALFSLWLAVRGSHERIERFRGHLSRRWPITLAAAILFAWCGLELVPKGLELIRNPWLENALPARHL